MNTRKLLKIFQNTHTHKKLIETAKLIYIIFIALAGFWPRDQNPRRHPRIPRVYTYKEFHVRK